MSDYMFILENHLSADQNRVVAEVRAAAAEANLNVFLSGGAMRDVLGGFQVRDLDFTIEGDALRIASVLKERAGGRMLAIDETRRAAEMLFPGGVTAEIAMARHERSSRTGGHAIGPATIQEDLRRRDFTVNAIALSLNPGSRGLLLDPGNGLADLGRRELCAVTGHVFHDDPVRLLRLIRLRVRLGFNVEERTAQQYANAREAHLENLIPRRILYRELMQVAVEPRLTESLKALAEEHLVTIFSPALTGTKFNVAGMTKLEKAIRMLPAGNGFHQSVLAPFLHTFTERLAPREKSALVKNMEMRPQEAALWEKLGMRSRRLEQALRSPRIRKPSQVYEILSVAAPDEILFLFCHSSYKTVQERIRSYLQKYVPRIQETPAAELEPSTGRPGSQEYLKAKCALIAKCLDQRPRRPKPAVMAVGSSEQSGPARVPGRAS